MTDTTLTSIDLAWVPSSRSSEWIEILDEARFALRQVDRGVLVGLGQRSMTIALDTTRRRWGQLRDLVSAIARGVWGEFKRAFRALMAGEFGAYCVELCKRAWHALRSFWDGLVEHGRAAARLIAAVPNMSSDELADTLVAFLSSVVGFAVMSGGGDGGVVDLDIAVLGLGGHRSILFHSVLSGLAWEIAMRCALEVVATFHDLLPRSHAPFWDRMLRLGHRGVGGSIAGGWAGVATHLAIDSHVDGWTPYKDLPVVLPQWGHHLVMDVNAAAAGWFAWQWRDKIIRTFSRPSGLPRAVQGQTLVVLDR